ncbi:MAG: hypothetical protein HY043_17255 [Verrucomicrobia bacterium]|nr:hypothetical protein [Verrucomicrobiota bacterium]
MNEEKLQQLRIASENKRRSSVPMWAIVFGVLAITATVIYLAVPRASDSERSGLKSGGTSTKSANEFTEKVKPGGASATGKTSSGSATNRSTAPSAAAAGKSDDALFTVSGYIINRERIELRGDGRVQAQHFGLQLLQNGTQSRG